VKLSSGYSVSSFYGCNRRQNRCPDSSSKNIVADTALSCNSWFRYLFAHALINLDEPGSPSDFWEICFCAVRLLGRVAD
jgi:hypothetical protein